jgi:hypothetical protein
LDGALIWTLMITNAERSKWPGDIDISDAMSKGIIVPSKIRTAKISPVETDKASLLGRLDDATIAAVREILADVIG